MIRDMKGLLPCILIIFTPLLLSAETRFGLTGESNSSYLFNSEADFTEFSNNLSLSPSMEWSGGAFEFKTEAELSFSLPEKEAEISLNELYLTYYNNGIIKAQIGRFFYLPGSAEFLSNTNYFSNNDYIRFIGSQGRDSTLPGDLFQLTLTGYSLYLKSSFALTPVSASSPTSDSPWLPTNKLADSIYLFSSGLYTRDNIYMEDPERPEINLSDLSSNFEIGLSSYWLDLSLQYYNGWDNTPLNSLNIDLKDENLFDITITPRYWKKTALGINLLSSVNSFHIWFDGSYTTNKKLQNSTIDIPSYNTTISEAPYLEGSTGFRYDFYWQDMTVLFEWKESRINSIEERIIKPYLSSALAGAVQLYLFDYRQRPGAFFLYNNDDKSWIGALQWLFQINDNFSIEASTARLMGKEDSLFGHYQQDFVIFLSLIYKR